MRKDGFGLDEEDGGQPLGESELIKVIFRDESVVNSMEVVLQLTRTNCKILRNFCKPVDITLVAQNPPWWK